MKFFNFRRCQKQSIHDVRSVSWESPSPTPVPVHPHCVHTGTRKAVLAAHGGSSRASRLPDVRTGVEVPGVLELTALPSIGEERWVPWVREADVLLVEGGDALYLCHWMRQSGLACLLPSLDRTVWVGLSAGSMVMIPRVGEEFVETKPSITGDDVTLAVVDFSIFPHLDYPDFAENTMANAERWAARIGGPAYAIDDQTAIKVVDGEVEVVSEGHWRYFGP